jgi:flagellar basal body-associated protein FliL
MRKLLLLPVLLAAALTVPGPAAFAAESGATADKPDKAKKDKKAAVHRITQSESYLTVDPLYTSIIDGSRPLGLLMLGIGLDVPDAELRDKIDRDMPQLRDAYVRSLMTYSATSVRSWRQPDVAAIADRLQGVTDRVLGKKGARVLLAQVVIRLNK